MFNTRSKTYIFLVDHNLDFLNSIKKSIEHPEVYEIFNFTSGERFIAYLNEKSFRKNDVLIVFLGYQFLDEGNQTLMNGIEILEATKVINKNIEVVMLSGENEGEFGAYVMKSGAHSFIPKNENIHLRINNIIMSIISKKRLEYNRHAFNIALRILLVYILIIIIIGTFYTLVLT